MISDNKPSIIREYKNLYNTETMLKNILHIEYEVFSCNHDIENNHIVENSKMHAQQNIKHKINF